MPDLPHPRPPQVTVAGWTVVVASAILVPSVYDALTGLRSVQTQAALRNTLTSGAGRDLGVSVAEATRIMHGVLLVGGAAAAALAVLGWFVMTGDRAARIAATVLAVPVVLCAPFGGGGLFAAIAAGGVGLLWTGVARDWFAGRQPRQARLPEPPSAPSGSPPPVAAPPPPPPSRPAGPDVRVSAPVTPVPPPTHGYGHVPGWVQPPPGQVPHPPVGGPWPGPVRPPERPAPVQTACVLTWVFSGITAGFGLLLMLTLAADPAGVAQAVHEVARRRGETVDASWVQPALWVGSFVLVLWSCGAAVLAAFVWRRQGWARIGLVVSAVLAALVGLFAFPLSVLHLAATAWVAGMLLSPVTRAWFRGH